MAPLKVLISGGGVGGTSLAFWLSKLGHAATVVEWYPNLRTTGLQIDLRGHGIEVMRRMGLEKAFREHAAPEEGMQFVDSKGRRRAYMGANKSGKGSQGITSEFEIMRGDLCRIIYEATNGRARYIFGTAVASFKDEGDQGIEVTLKNGTTERYDLWVGADGIHSATRKLVLGAEASEAAFHAINTNSAYMTFARKMQPDERYIGQMYLATNKRSMLLRRHNPDQMQLYMILSETNAALAKAKRGDVPAEKDAFAETFAGAGWCVSEMIDEMYKADDFYCERQGIVKLDSWVRGNVALLGDAGFGTGSSGQGTTCAMVGAYVLAGEIGRRCGRGDDPNNKRAHREGLAEALKAYDTDFRPYMDDIQKGAGESKVGKLLTPTSPMGIEVMHRFLSTAMFFRIDALAMAMFHGANERWPLPDYAELREAKAEEDAKQAAVS